MLYNCLQHLKLLCTYCDASSGKLAANWLAAITQKTWMIPFQVKLECEGAVLMHFMFLYFVYNIYFTL